jgi:hypothetical protein
MNERVSTDWRVAAGRLTSHRGVAPLVALLVATLCVAGVFTVSKIFYFRDLAVFHWPHHRWLRRTLLAGQSPFWDPNPGGGYSTIGDAALHVAFLPMLPMRFLPEIVGFNLAVALPFPIAALGMYLFARRHASSWASAVAAIAYSASGPVLSTGNCNNLSWCAAIVPFIFWTVDGLAERPSARRFALLALLFALELSAGEPVTLVGTAVLATAYAAFAAPDAKATWRNRAKSALTTIGAGLAGLCLAAAQALPLLDATRRSIRGSGMLGDTWSLHPMRLAETALPFVYGNYLGLQGEMSPWLFALNSRREPFLLSLYVGAFVLIVATAGVFAARRRGWAVFWCIGIAAALLCAFGSMTPVYPVLQKVVPLLSSFRYPSKYVVLAMLPLAAFVAVGWDGLTTTGGRLLAARRAATAASLVVIAGLIVFVVMTSTGAGSAMLLSMAGMASDPAPGSTTDWLARSVMRLIPAVVVVVASALLLAWFGGPEGSRAPLVRAAAIAVFSIDLILLNGGLNPTIDASLFDAPEWVTATRPSPDFRVHVAAPFAQIPGRVSADVPPPVSFPDGVPPAAFLAVRNTTLCQYPSAWDVRQSLSLEMTGLRPREYLTLIESFTRAERSEQFRFLRYTGTRYALVSKEPPPPSRVVMPLPQLAPMQLYELGEPEPRVRMASAATVEPDTERAIAALFNPFVVPTSSLVVEREPLDSGLATATSELPSARVEAETTTSVTVRAIAPDTGGYLVLLDSFDPGWSATVDGESAEVVRAWGVYRAVRVAPGAHTVEFTYVSQPFRIGFAVSVATAFVLLAFAVRRPRTPAGATPDDGPAVEE